MRIASLLPAATEWVACFGGVDDLIGRSHSCDYPASIQELPVLTQTHIDSDRESATIDASVQGRLQQGLSLYAVNLDQLRALRPDVVLTQAQCEVCAVTQQDLESLLAETTGVRPNVFSYSPMTLKQVFDAALQLARTIGRIDQAIPWLGAAERRLHLLRAALGLHGRRIRIPCRRSSVSNGWSR